MDCLVLGGFGYIGSRIIDYLSLKNIEITVGTHNLSYKKFSNLKIIKDYRDLNKKDLMGLLKNYDLVIDCSGISGTKTKVFDIPEIIELNTLWPAKLAKACIKTNTRLIWFSTIHCNNLISDKNTILRGNIYAISKKMAEESILEISSWDNFITIIRLGNIIGSPGKIYNGNSKLFPLDIIKQLVLNSKAIIKSNPNNKIGFLAFSKFLDSEFFEKPGFYSLYNNEETSLYLIAKTIQESYFQFTNKESQIIYQGEIKRNNNQEISKEIKTEIELMVNYFLSKGDFKI